MTDRLTLIPAIGWQKNNRFVRFDGDNVATDMGIVAEVAPKDRREYAVKYFELMEKHDSN